MAKKLKDINEAPAPRAADVDAAQKAGAELVGWHPDQLRAFLAGQITLADLEGIDKESQVRMAKVGHQYLTEGKLDLAKRVFEGLTMLDPFDAYFHAALGSVAHQQGELEEAEARYSRALEINPFFAVALAHRGEVRVLLGKLVEAAQDLTRAIEEDPEGKEPATRRARATALLVRKELEAAQQS